MYSKIKKVCIVTTIISIIIIIGLYLSGRAQRRFVEQIRTAKIIIPSEEMEKLSPQKEFYYTRQKEPALYRLLLYTDSLQCSPCRLKSMVSWYRFIEESWEKGVRMDFYFVFSPKAIEIDSFYQNYRNSRFLFPVFLDKDGAFLRENALVRERSTLRCFIVDSLGRIVFVGNPTRQEQIETRFMDFLQTLCVTEEELYLPPA